MNILEEALNLQDEIVQWRRDLHETPEVGNELPLTSIYVQNILKEIGIPFKTLVNGSAIVGLIESGHPGKVVALRADMDGLAIQEESELEFKSKNCNMHACGHDAHTAMLLGAAKILFKYRDKLKGIVKLIFQPGEESPGGALPMIEEGVLENPKVDAIFGMHTGALITGVASGKILISKSHVMAGKSSFEITIKGKEAHSSMPHLSIDPIPIAAQIVNSIYLIKAREIDALKPAVISICTLNTGIANKNLASQAYMEGFIRAQSTEMCDFIVDRMSEIVKLTCQMFRAEAEFKFTSEYPALINNLNLANLAMDTAIKIVGKENVIEQINPLMCAEDMAYFQEKVPGTYFFLSSIVEQEGVVYPHHNSRFMLDESVFYIGTAMFCQLVMDYNK